MRGCSHSRAKVCLSVAIFIDRERFKLDSVERAHKCIFVDGAGLILMKKRRFTAVVLLAIHECLPTPILPVTQPK